MRGLEMTVAAPLTDLSENARRFVSAGPHPLLIGGERAAAADGRTFQSVDPASGKAIAELAHAGSEDVDRAVKAARAAFEEGPWPSMPAAQRGRLIAELAQLVAANADE